VSIGEVAHRLLGADGSALRTTAADAAENYERAMLRLRSQLVRHLVEDEQLTLADAARRMGISRQRLARLYDLSRQVPRTRPR
jgi:predicted DNA-binding protein (UPF0251 family)